MQNLPFLDPTEYIHVTPDVIEDVLEVGFQATVCEFNRRGTLIAVGTSDGRVIVFDFETRSWSADGRKLLTSSTDGQVLVYDVLTSKLEKRFQLGLPIFFVQFHPRKNSVILVCPMAFHPPFLVDLNQVDKADIPSLAETPRTDLAVPIPVSTTIPPYSGTTSVRSTGDASRIIVAYRDTAYLFDSSSPSDPPLATLSLPVAASSEKSSGSVRRYFGSPIALSGSSHRILLNCYFDRSLRMIWVDDKELRIERELHDSVTRQAFRCCTFSISPRFFSMTRTVTLEEEESEFIVACTHDYMTHFSFSTGVPISFLSPPAREEFLDIKFNPTSARPLLAAASSGGVAYVWGRGTSERGWERWIPGMKEIEENQMHQEREDEFDEIVAPAEGLNDDDGLLIDITTIEKSGFSDDEITSELIHLPTEPEPDVVESATAPEEKKKRAPSRRVKPEDPSTVSKPKKSSRKSKKSRSNDNLDDDSHEDRQREMKRERDRRYRKRKRERLAAEAAAAAAAAAAQERLQEPITSPSSFEVSQDDSVAHVQMAEMAGDSVSVGKSSNPDGVDDVSMGKSSNPDDVSVGKSSSFDDDHEDASIGQNGNPNDVDNMSMDKSVNPQDDQEDVVMQDNPQSPVIPTTS